MSGERRGEWQDWPFDPLAVLRVLRDHEIEYVLIGGVAAVLQGSLLPTYDIDITSAPQARNRTHLLAALAELDATLLTEIDDVEQALREETDLSFYTPFGHVDVHPRPSGFATYGELRCRSRPIQLEPDLIVQALSLRDIIRSRLAAGDDRQLPALEAALGLEGPEPAKDPPTTRSRLTAGEPKQALPPTGELKNDGLFFSCVASNSSFA